MQKTACFPGFDPLNKYRRRYLISGSDRRSASPVYWSGWLGDDLGKAFRMRMREIPQCGGNYRVAKGPEVWHEAQLNPAPEQRR